MSGNFRDHHVRFQSRDQIAAEALRWWRRGKKDSRLHFNVCRFLTEVVAPTVPRGLSVFPHPDNELLEPAFVEFPNARSKPLELHINSTPWSRADEGHAYARFIVAHEIGHIVLHDRPGAIGFSNDGKARPKYLDEGNSAETQANWFADAFLVPDHVALQLNDVDLIAISCVVTDDVAARRLNDVQFVKKSLSALNQELCCECGNFTAAITPSGIKCDFCGAGKDFGI